MSSTEMNLEPILEFHVVKLLVGIVVLGFFCFVLLVSLVDLVMVLVELEQLAVDNDVVPVQVAADNGVGYW